MQLGPVRLTRLMANAPIGAWVLVVLWALVILVIMTQPGLGEMGGRRFRFSATSAGHIAFFLVLAFLVGNAVATASPTRRWWWAFILTTIYGILTEVVQSGVPARTPSMADVTADVIGAGLGASAYALMERWRGGATVPQALAGVVPRPRRRKVVKDVPRLMHPEA